MEASTNTRDDPLKKQYTCTQLREAGLLTDAASPACCPFCHTRTHPGKEGQDTMHYEYTPEGRLLILCCQVDAYLRPVNHELDDELKVIEGHIGA